MKKGIEYSLWVIVIIGACLYYNNLWLSIIFIFFHELGHFLAGRIVGLNFNAATLLPFGIRFGFKEEFINPLKDIFVSFAGPFINLLFFIMSFFLSKKIGYFELVGDINLILFVFNLLPAAFLDGGRILKAVIAMKYGVYYGYITTNINGIILGVFIVILSMIGDISIKRIPLILMGIFFIYKGVWGYRNRTIGVVNDILLRKQTIKELSSLCIIMLVCNGKMKILDIIKKFCFNKYYFIYIMDNGYLRYNINETNLIKLYCTYGNIYLEECEEYLKVKT